MLISGFTFARNTDKLGYPTVESIQSILPVCDEFIIAVGKGDEDDTTREKIAALNDPRITIIDTAWTDINSLRSRIYSQQTNIALSHCSGTWCFYLQCDEVIHERYLDTIRHACSHFKDTPSVDGFLFNYRHFWGDYDHYFVNHRWYPREIRVIRNHRSIISVGDAQSFRYRSRKKVPVVALDAEVFHYGHVRDPRLVNVRKTVVQRIYRGVDAQPTELSPLFDYGSLEHLPIYRGTYPATMKARVASIAWKHLLTYCGPSETQHGHERLKYRVLTWIEQKIFRGSGQSSGATNRTAFCALLRYTFAVRCSFRLTMGRQHQSLSRFTTIPIFSRRFSSVSNVKHALTSKLLLQMMGLVQRLPTLFSAGRVDLCTPCSM